MSKPWSELTPEEKSAHYERTKRWRQTEKGRLSHNASTRKYRATHPEFAETQRQISSNYYHENRVYINKQHKVYNHHWYQRNKLILRVRFRDYKRKRRAAEKAEEQSIARYMERVEADATATFSPDPVRLGKSPITKRADKRDRGVTHRDTVALRLAARKVEPLPIEDNPVRIGVDRDDPNYKGVRYHNHLLRSGRRGRKPITPQELRPPKPMGGTRIEHKGHKKVKEAKKQSAKLRREGDADV